jgi:hypothetical protein
VSSGLLAVPQALGNCTDDSITGNTTGCHSVLACKHLPDGVLDSGLDLRPLSLADSLRLSLRSSIGLGVSIWSTVVSLL